MIKIKKITYILLIIIILAILILNNLTIKPVYAVRSAANDFSNLINYPTIYTLVRELQTAHPTWNFTMLYTGLDWNSVIWNETMGHHSKSLVQKYVIDGDLNDWICPVCGTYGYDNGSWYCASAKTASYYIDPRNWLDEETIFSMESLIYDPNIQSLEGVQKILEGTFMDVNRTPYITYIDTNGQQQIIYKTYAQIFMEAGQAYNVSPYALASRVRQEQGDGTSALISGQYTYTNPETNEQIVFIGYYNYFNIGATGGGTANIVKNGLKKAQEKGWSSPELAIHGGAKFLQEEYLTYYQDTGYLQKYAIDPAGGNLYNYQYMQNVSAPYSEGRTTKKAYVNMGLMESGFNFIVPVFENMPEMASPRPGTNMEIVTENVVVTTNIFPLTIRSTPGGSKAGEAPKGAILTRIEKAIDPIGGVYWDKVVCNINNQEVIGYASREYLGDLETVPTVNEAKVTTEMCNLRNWTGTTESRVKQVLSVGTRVTVIDKNNAVRDGHIWYRVRLDDGTEGYVSSAFLQDGVVEKYKIEGTYVKIAPETAITEIPGAVLNSDVLGTGAIITINGVEYTAVVLGDVNGDGVISPADYVRIKNHIMGSTPVEGVYTMGADVNRDGSITPADYVRVKNHIMGSVKIYL